jgi:hypothetical protein
MKKLIGIALLSLVSLSAPAQSHLQTFTGEISDSQCALNVHSKTGSHKEMLAENTMGKNEADCVKTCVKYGGVYVLVTPKKVYRLSDQTTPEKFAAQKVVITGSLDKKGNTIIVQSIQAGN